MIDSSFADRDSACTTTSQSRRRLRLDGEVDGLCQHASTIRRVEAVKSLGRNLKINRLPTSQADQNHSPISTTTKDLLNAHAQGQEKWWIFRYLELWNIREPYSCPWCENLSTTVEWHNWIQKFLTCIESHQHDRTTIFEVIHIEYILINKVMYFIFSEYGYVMW